MSKSLPKTHSPTPSPDGQSKLYWRPMKEADFQTVYDISLKIHGGLPEDIEIYKERQALFGQGCLVLVQDDEIMGYTISHPIRPDCPPPLNSLLTEIPNDATDFYIHDVAILPAMRGNGMAKQGIQRLLDIGKKYTRTALISVYGTGDFWGKFGFVQDNRDFSKKLEPYGETAIFMHYTTPQSKL